MTTLELESWHHKHLGYVHEHADYEGLEILCTTVAEALGVAVNKLQELRGWSQQQMLLPDGKTDRSIALSALDDVMDALKAFEVVVHDPILHIHQTKSMVLIYLRSVLKVTIILGKLLGSPHPDSWFENFEGFIHHLKGFEFDSAHKYEIISNPTAAGVIADAAAIPEPYLPLHPSAPRLYRSFYQSDGEYRPRIVLN